ncbi:Os11g0272425 [Oryza sativa Japonica Group]|uniref:Os11g0272425 protein n=1 Tax=Oryza sativa subsp. japonica TaxID=39947 RepID=A0A0P0Y0Z2_ORYSJ|nr:Os11g0272425 [Oryza sativa Japonica Group]
MLVFALSTAMFSREVFTVEIPNSSTVFPPIARSSGGIPFSDGFARFFGFSRSSPDSVLGPMGDPDPTDLINAETERIPFKQTKPDLAQWKLTIHFWPSKLKGYRSWYKRLAAAKRYHWEEIGIA